VSTRAVDDARRYRHDELRVIDRSLSDLRVVLFRRDEIDVAVKRELSLLAKPRRWSQFEHVAGLVVGLEVPQPGISAPDPASAEPREAVSQSIHRTGKESLVVVEDSCILDHVEKKRAAREDFTRCLEDRRALGRVTAPARDRGLRRQRLLHRCEILHARQPSVRKRVGDDQQIEVGIGARRPAAHRPEHDERDKTIAIMTLRNGRYVSQQLLDVIAQWRRLHAVTLPRGEHPHLRARESS